MQESRTYLYFKLSLRPFFCKRNYRVIIIKQHRFLRDPVLFYKKVTKLHRIEDYQLTVSYYYPFHSCFKDIVINLLICRYCKVYTNLEYTLSTYYLPRCKTVLIHWIRWNKRPISIQVNFLLLAYEHAFY
jgi:hypothetical protein